MSTQHSTDPLPAMTPATFTANKPQPAVKVPRLEVGDRLSRAEFERRYEAMPNLKKAELIEGVVYVPSPTARPHGKGHFRIVIWLGGYFTATPGVECGNNETLRLDLDNEPQPDAMLWIVTAYGGRARVGDDRFLEGSPELVTEVASSSVSYDLHVKLNVYRRNGVQEYIVWRVLDEDLDWFVLREGRYEPLAPTDDGILKSEVFPGLWLNKPALLRDDMPAVLATLQQGLASPEHGEFIAKLKSVKDAGK